MKKTRSVLMGLFGFAAATMLAGAVPTQDTGAAAKAKVGEGAPNFTLRGVDGKEYTLEDYRDKIVVLQWINPDCPVCLRVMSTGVEEKMIEELKRLDEDYVHLAINSTHYMSPEDSKKYLEEHEIDIVALIDADGKVGKLYNARTTPHLFVIDQKGVLRYDGAIDNGSGNRSGDTNYVVNAVKAIKAGETVAPDTTKPYGCNVKYKASR